MLQSIKIEGYKSIRKLELNLTPINILIGSNGVGKSNFISFFKLINNIYEQRLQNYSLKMGKADSFLHFGKKHTQEIKGFLDFGSNTYKFTLQASIQDSLFLAYEECTTSFENEIYFFKENSIESTLRNSPFTKSSYIIQYLENLKNYHFHDTSKYAPLRSVSDIDDNRRLREDGKNIAAFLYYLQEKHPKTFLRIENNLKDVIPGFERFNLAPDMHVETSIKLEWNEVNFPDNYFNATHLSDGSLRYIALTTLLCQPDLPKVIIIDEPELGLHPVAINKLAAMIRSASEKGTQIIISTQSINLLNNFAPEEIITVDKEDNQSVFHRLNSEELDSWLNDYTIGELWTKSVIKGQPL